MRHRLIRIIAALGIPLFPLAARLFPSQHGAPTRERVLQGSLEPSAATRALQGSPESPAVTQALQGAPESRTTEQILRGTPGDSTGIPALGDSAELAASGDSTEFLGSGYSTGPSAPGDSVGRGGTVTLPPAESLAGVFRVPVRGVTPRQPEARAIQTRTVPGDGKFSFLGSIRNNDDQEWLYLKEVETGRIISINAETVVVSGEGRVIEIEGASYFFRSK